MSNSVRRIGALALSAGAFAAAMASFSACEDTSSSADEELLQSLIPAVVLPGLDRFAADASALATAASAYCAAPEDSELGDVQDAWSTARTSWKRLEVLAFGPYAAYPDRFGPNIDSYPVRTDTLDAYFATSEGLTAADVAAAGSTRRGLPPIEYALFAADPSDPAVCRYVTAATEDLVNLANGYALAWAPEGGGFATAMLSPSDDFVNPHAAVSEFVNRMGFTIENLRRDKLGAPLGDGGGSVDAGAVESRFSGRSLQDARDAVGSVDAFFEGGDGPDDQGMVDQLNARGRADVIAAFRAAREESLQALDAVPEPLADALVSDPASVEAAIAALGVLQRVIQVDIAGALNSTMTFNDADGD